MITKHTIKKTIVANFKLFIFVVPIAILAVGYVYFLKPKYEKVQIAGGLTLKTLNDSFKVKMEYLDNLKNLEKSYNNLSPEEKEKLKQTLPFEEDLPNLFVHFEKLVKESGFSLGSIKFIPGTEEGKVKTLNIELGLDDGNYQSLKSFLVKLERDVKIIDVEAVSFSASGYSLKLKTYFFVGY